MAALTQTLSPGLRQTATAHLAQTMTILALASAELEENVRAELDNPALEVVDEHRCRACGRPIQRRGYCAVCADRGGTDGPIVYFSPRGWDLGGAALSDDDFPEPTLISPEKLAEHLLRQLGPELERQVRPVAAHIIYCLDEDGLLREHPAEIAQRLGSPLFTVKHIINLLQRVDPPGIGAASPQESLLIQLEALAETGESTVPPLAAAMIAEHFKSLGRYEYGHIARLLSAPRMEVERAALFIRRNLTPYPARAFWGSGRGGMQLTSGRYFHPDVTISQHPIHPGGPLIVEITTPTNGWLRVNPLFKEALKTCPDSDRGKWERDYDRALLYTKCLQQRNNTMRRLLETIVGAQKAFILSGDRFLKPMTRAYLAARLEVHESTISRAVAGKTAALPGGRMVPLSKFFDRSLSVREVIKDLILAERPGAPLTDEAIVAGLGRQDIHIARRTVAKYRAAEGILPAAMRGRIAVPRA